MNKFKLASILILATLCVSLSAEENKACQQEEASTSKIQKKAFKLFSPKKQKQILDKVKENLTPEKQEELIKGIVDSTLSDSQKAGLIEALDGAKTTVEKYATPKE